MKLRGFPVVSLLVLLAFAFPNSWAQTNTFVVPAGMGSAFGEVELRPFRGEYPVFEQLYFSNSFIELPTNTIMITEMAFRVDEKQMSDMDRKVSGLLVAMNTFRGPLEEIVRRGSGYQFPRVTVYHADLRVQGRVGITNAFDIRIPLQTPFLYDRRKGHLVVAFGRLAHDQYIELDAHQLATGIAIYSGGSNPPLFAHGNLVTKFSYILPPRISGIRFSSGEIELALEFPGLMEHLQVETSPTVSGPYLAVVNAVFTSHGSGKGTAKFDAPNGTLFMRIRQLLP